MYCIPVCFSQDNFGKVTSQSADFIRYGLVPVSYFSGKAKIEIPLYTLEDPDFSIPLSLNYVSDGLKPAKHPGLVGLDWTLNFSGIITREVYGAPDDANGYSGHDPSTNTGYNMEKGFWNALQEKKYSAEQLLKFDPSAITCNAFYCNLPTTSDGYDYDAQPDLFLFRFPGGTGSFMITNDGNIKSNDPKIKVDLSDFSTQYVTNNIPNNSAIKITDGNGYVYYFGGDVSSLEYRIKMKPNHTLPLTERRPVIMAWHLVKVQAPNGRIMNFNYTSGFRDLPYSPYWQAAASSNDAAPLDQRSYSAVKGVYPESITIPDTGVSIYFSLSEETCRNFYLRFQDYNKPSFQLNSISIKQDGKPIYNYNFEYENKQHLRFLKKVTMPDVGIYQLEYNHTDYPEPDTRYVDHWGYWSPNYNSMPLPYGLLKTIIYPTGGSSDLSYEPHQYSKRVETQVNPNSFNPNLVNKEGIAGGFRVSSICNMNGMFEKRKCYKFKYEDENGNDSGILYQYPPYYIDKNKREIFIVSDIWYKNYNIEDQHVGYSYVKEYFDDGSNNHYTYSDYITNPDHHDVYLKRYTQASELNMVLCNVNRVSSASQERGRLLIKRFYNNNNTLLKKESYSYREIIDLDEPLPFDSTYYENPNNSDYIVSFRPMEGGALAKKVYLKSYPLLRNIERSYFPQGLLISTKQYKYSSFDQLIEQTESCSDGSTLKTIYTYPNNYQSLSTPNVYNHMVSANIINNPIEKTNFRNTLRLSSSRITYRMNGNLPVKDTVMQAFGNQPYLFEVTYPYYDSHGHALLEVCKNDTRTIRLWGYKSRYLVAEIRNIPDTNMDYIWNIIQPKVFSSKPTPDFSFVNILRNSYPNIQVYLYTYSPLIGPTSVTAPNGTKTNYYYDAAGRLIKISDHNESVKTMYEYNYHKNF